MTQMEASECIEFNEYQFDTCCRIVEQMRDGLLTVLLTGKGEPMLHLQQITRYLDCINRRFPLIELQTNGTLIKENITSLQKWRNRGLTLVCISIAAESIANNRLMGIKDDSYDFWEAAKILQDIGLNVRLNCTMTRAGISRPEDCDRLIDRAFKAQIDQVTFREVTKPVTTLNQKISGWIEGHQAPGAATRLSNYLLMQGATQLLELPHGGMVYDYHDQNVAISNCLTGTTDPNDIRQIIFFPDGRVAYDWRYKGARLL